MPIFSPFFLFSFIFCFLLFFFFFFVSESVPPFWVKRGGHVPLRPHPNLRACKMGPSLNDKYMWQKQFLTYKKLKLYHIFHCTVFILNMKLIIFKFMFISLKYSFCSKLINWFWGFYFISVLSLIWFYKNVWLIYLNLN